MEEIFRRRLLETLRKRNMTQTDLAIRMHTYNATVNSWCSGKVTPTAYMLCGICKVLDVSADYLLGLKN